MKVENRVSPPNYFSRREQYRLLVMCGMLMLVLVMMNEVRKPQMWRWMWAGSDLAEVEQGDWRNRNWEARSCAGRQRTH